MSRFRELSDFLFDYTISSDYYAIKLEEGIIYVLDSWGDTFFTTDLDKLKSPYIESFIEIFKKEAAIYDPVEYDTAVIQEFGYLRDDFFSYIREKKLGEILDQ